MPRDVQPCRVFGNPDWVDWTQMEACTPTCYSVGLLLPDVGIRFGCCLRVSNDWILTAHHVIDIPDLARRFTVKFAYVARGQGFSYKLDPDSGFFTSDDGIQGAAGDGFDLDYAFIRIKGPFKERDLSIDNPLSADPTPVKGAQALIAQYSGAGPMQFPIEHSVEHADAGRIIEFDDEYIFHKRSTNGGASGSPIFDGSWNLIGVHTHGRLDNSGDPLRDQNNWGTRISAIVADAKTRGFDMSDIPFLDEL